MIIQFKCWRFGEFRQILPHSNILFSFTHFESSRIFQVHKKQDRKYYNNMYALTDTILQMFIWIFTYIFLNNKKMEIQLNHVQHFFPSFLPKGNYCLKVSCFIVCLFILFMSLCLNIWYRVLPHVFKFFIEDAYSYLPAFVSEGIFCLWRCSTPAFLTLKKSEGIFCLWNRTQLIYSRSEVPMSL